MFYWSRKNLFKNGVHLDLTKERFTLYQKARDLVKSKKFVNYLYVDVKCQLKIKFKNSQQSCFSCISELLDLTDQECNHGVLDMELKELICIKFCKTRSCLYRCFFF